jgi:DNA invertase Pin-like site-specific DNA recombinase
VPPRVRLVLGLAATPELIRGGRRLSGKAMFQIMRVFAEFERAMIRERVLAGLARVKEQGVSRLGPPMPLKTAIPRRSRLSKLLSLLSRGFVVLLGRYRPGWTALRIKAELAV